MPRRARLILPNVPLHITQRGVNRAAIFIDDEDRHHYRKLLHEACAGNAIAVHAFVLMDNHVHLLLTPSRPEVLAAAMRAVGQSYVQFFNYRHGRSGTLWQGRFKSCLVDSDRYALGMPLHRTEPGAGCHGRIAGRIPLVQRTHASWQGP